MAKQDTTWQMALSLFITLSGWVAGPIIVALIVGRWLDQRWNNEPWGTLTMIGIAFLISNIALVREGRRAIRQIEDQTKSKQNQIKKDDQRDTNN